MCLGLPGALPVLNEAAVESAIRIGLALNCEIAPWCRFARKNYFYPDQPKNYQISQYDEPIAINGYLDVPLDDGTTWRVEIERAHMEEDTGKLTHLGSDTGRIDGATTSLLDFNRAGVPLIEIVTKPIEGAGERAPEIARAYVTALRDLLRALGCLRRPDGPGLDALRRQRVAAADRRRPSSAPAPRPRTSTRSRASRWRSATRCAARQRFSPPAARSTRRPGTSTRTATPRRAATRRPPRTTGTSPNPTWSRWRPARSSSSGCATPSPSFRGCRASEFSRSGASPTR